MKNQQCLYTRLASGLHKKPMAAKKQFYLESKKLRSFTIKYMYFETSCEKEKSWKHYFAALRVCYYYCCLTITNITFQLAIANSNLYANIKPQTIVEGTARL
jgi:hypothetical protein